MAALWRLGLTLHLGKRFCLFFTALCFAGAASGLISGAVISGLEGVKGMRGWRWLFLIEGLVTIGVAIVSVFVLADYPETATHRLSEDERRLAIVRIMHDKKESATNRRKLTPFESVKAAVVDLRTYFFIVLYMTQNGSTTVSYFIPTVLKSMGYTGTTAQWMTVPIWAVCVHHQIQSVTPLPSFPLLTVSSRRSEPSSSSSFLRQPTD